MIQCSALLIFHSSQNITSYHPFIVRMCWPRKSNQSGWSNQSFPTSATFVLDPPKNTTNTANTANTLPLERFNECSSLEGTGRKLYYFISSFSRRAVCPAVKSGLVLLMLVNKTKIPHTIRLIDNQVQSAHLWHTLNRSTDHETWIYLR